MSAAEELYLSNVSDNDNNNAPVAAAAVLPSAGAASGPARAAASAGPAGREVQILHLFQSDGRAQVGELRRILPAMGAGVEATTYKGVYFGNAVTIKVFSNSGAAVARVENEFNLAQKYLSSNCFKRPNLLCFLGMLLSEPTAAPVANRFFSPDFEAGSTALIYEHAKGMSLTSYINEYGRRPGPVRGFEKIMYETLKGVGQLHALGLVHRDLKPDNIIVNPRDGKVKIIDYGTLCEAATCPFDDSGTLIYQAPNRLGYNEAAAGAPSVYKPTKTAILYSSDLWATGLIFYELFAKRRLIETDGDMFRLTENRSRTPIPINTTPPTIFKDYEYFKFVIESLLKKNTKDRINYERALRLLQYAILERAKKIVKRKEASNTIAEIEASFGSAIVSGQHASEVDLRLVNFVVDSILESELGNFEGGSRARGTRHRRRKQRRTRRRN